MQPECVDVSFIKFNSQLCIFGFIPTSKNIGNDFTLQCLFTNIV